VHLEIGGFQAVAFGEAQADLGEVPGFVVGPLRRRSLEVDFAVGLSGGQAAHQDDQTARSAFDAQIAVFQTHFV